MTSPFLPADLQARLVQLIEAHGRPALKEAQARASAIYRDGGASDNAIPNATAAVAYAAVRMPATYAACVRAFDLVAEALPGFAPRTHLDLGAGPATAALAARTVWPALEAQTLIEPNSHLSALGAMMVSGQPGITWQSLRLSARDKVNQHAELVTFSYVLSEIPAPEIDGLLNGLRGCFQRVLLIVEPGTRHGFERILRARQALLAMGAKIVAPCPHERACPLTQSDWCHFQVRLQRSAAHKAIKDADVPYEDEPFAFLAASFDPALNVARPAARLLTDPAIEKGFADLTLCTEEGARVTRRVMRRDKSAYKAAKDLKSGDGV